MPIVKSEQVYVDDKPFTRKVKCSSQGVFTCDLPTFVSSDMDMDKYGQPAGKSLAECLEQWHKMIKEYESITYETLKVICFNFDKEGFFDEGLAVSVAANVFEQTKKTDRSGDSTYRYKRVSPNELSGAMRHKFDPNNRGAHYSRQIPFTEKNEAFFAGLGTAMEDLQGRLESLTSTPDSVIKFISSGHQLLGIGSHDA